MTYQILTQTYDKAPQIYKTSESYENALRIAHGMEKFAVFMGMSITVMIRLIDDDVNKLVYYNTV